MNIKKIYQIIFVSFLMSSNLFSAEKVIRADAQGAIRRIKSQRKTVVTFLGYSGKGYKDLKGAMTKAHEILKTYSPQKTIVNIGVTPEGIGQIYCIAKKMGFKTTGIVSSLAENYITYDSTKCVDEAYIIQDTSWGGRDKNGKLNPTSNAMVNASDILIRLGGGEIALIEAQEADKLRKKVITFEFDAGTKNKSEQFLE